MAKVRDSTRSFTFISHNDNSDETSRLRRSAIQRHVALQTKREKKRQEGDVEAKQRKGSWTEGQPYPTPESTASDNSSDSASGHQCAILSAPGNLWNDQPTLDDILLPCPQTLLSGSRIDSFNAVLPISDPRELELSDYLTNVIWPGFSQYGARKVNNPYAAGWLHRSYGNPALHHSLMLASSVHLAANCRHFTQQQQQEMLEEQLYHQNEAMYHVRTLCNSAEMASADVGEMVMTLLCLATHSIDLATAVEAERTKDEWNPFTPPLKDGNWINLCGALEITPVHWSALLEVIQCAGGIETIKGYGISWLVS